ncbi:uncharacterized protein LOC134853032 [Symsagittifera roscoffensis]|uniref:uncharacterized protein LOC134853032 n=1 Tax=Symsagittifera roscoffensis TaxID=84072 RepID=UPI00307C273C
MDSVYYYSSDSVVTASGLSIQHLEAEEATLSNSSNPPTPILTVVTRMNNQPSNSNRHAFIDYIPSSLPADIISTYDLPIPIPRYELKNQLEPRLKPIQMLKRIQRDITQILILVPLIKTEDIFQSVQALNITILPNLIENIEKQKNNFYYKMENSQISQIREVYYFMDTLEVGKQLVKLLQEVIGFLQFKLRAKARSSLNRRSVCKSLKIEKKDRELIKEMSENVTKLNEKIVNRVAIIANDVNSDEE